LLTTDVLGQHNGPTFIARPEASVTANLDCVASQEGEDIFRSSFFVMDFMLATCRPKFPSQHTRLIRPEAECGISVLLPRPLRVRTPKTKTSTHLMCRSRFYACVCRTQTRSISIVITHKFLCLQI